MRSIISVEQHISFNRYLTISLNTLPSENFTMLIPFCGADMR